MKQPKRLQTSKTNKDSVLSTLKWQNYSPRILVLRDFRWSFSENIFKMVDQTQEINKKVAWELATNAPENSSEELRLPLEMTFNEGHVVSIVTYSILMVTAAVGNITVLVILLKRRRNMRSRINTMVMHLAIADLMVSVLLKFIFRWFSFSFLFFL